MWIPPLDHISASQNLEDVRRSAGRPSAQARPVHPPRRKVASSVDAPLDLPAPQAEGHMRAGKLQRNTLDATAVQSCGKSAAVNVGSDAHPSWSLWRESVRISASARITRRVALGISDMDYMLRSGAASGGVFLGCLRAVRQCA